MGNASFKMIKYYIPRNMPGASVLVDNKYLYYASMNTNMLVKLDVSIQRVVDIYYIPEKHMNMWLIRDIYRYENKLFLIPSMATRLYVFDMDRNVFYSIEDKIMNGYDVAASKFVESASDGRYVWIPSAQKKQLFKLDMHKEIMIEIDLSKVSCADKLGQAILNDRCVYLMSKDDGEGIKVNRKDDEVSMWSGANKLFYGCICEDNLFYATVKGNVEGIWMKNVCTERKSKVLDIQYPDSIQLYWYWKVKKVGNLVFFLPFESKELVVYDVKTKEVRIQDKMFNNKELYLVDTEKRFYEIYDVKKYDRGYILAMPYQHCLIFLDEQLQIESIFEQDINIKDVIKQEFNAGPTKERAKFGLEVLLSYEEKKVINNQFNVGADIHKKIKELL